MKKRAWTFLLILGLIFSLMPPHLAEADDIPVNRIETVTVYVAPPAIGTKAESADTGDFISVPWREGYSVLQAEWATGSGEAFSGTFEAGETYFAQITLVSDKGYTFQQGGGSWPNTTVTVKGAHIVGNDLLAITNMYSEESGYISYGYLTAAFTPAEGHAVTVSSSGKGSVTVSRTLASEGTRVTVTAKADPGFVLYVMGVHDDEGQISATVYGNSGMTEDTIDFKMRKSDVRVFVDFIETADGPGSVLRIAGPDRVSTSLRIAARLKEVTRVDKFETAVIATGKNFPDALAGGYLASTREAPIILLTADKKLIAQATDYIKKNVKEKAVLFVLGGEPAVPSAWLEELEKAGYYIYRLEGADRYETDLKILQEIGIKDKSEILVATGRNYADALSASAVPLPVFLVNNYTGVLTDAQKAFLSELKQPTFHILGAEAAVPAALEEELKQYGAVDRVAGDGRWETSVAVAERFFSSPEAVTLAYSQNFPDGLCGGVLAGRMNAPLLLVTSAANRYTSAMNYAANHGLKSGAVFGGAQLVDDDAASRIAGGATVTPY